MQTDYQPVIPNTMKDLIKKVCSEVADERPYKQAGNADSYSSYNEGWSDACDILEQRLIEQLLTTEAETPPTEMQILKWQNKALVEALQYLVDTKERKDTIGKDSIYMARKDLGWRKAKLLLNDIKD